ncbi:hypothetical protein [Chamaesiphon sp.]|uniref:hypothetical protein n=1 Tax=Chamaesiphon sp. TaxID=2814140 RepID=UPI003593F74A
MNIIVIFVILILLGIIIGSNLLPTMTVVILNQPTVALPIGVWLAIAIGAGLLSSSLIQLAIFVDRRLLDRQLRQQQSRIRQPDPDIFTYTSASPETDDSSPDKSATPPTKTSRFKSYRSPLTDRSNHPPSAQPTSVDDSDDWDAEPAANRQLDWEDSPLPFRPQQWSSPPHRSTIVNDLPPERQSQRIYPDRDTASIDSEPQPPSREVYDADFRLIQPPYKQPLANEFDDNRESFRPEDTDTNQAEDDARSTTDVQPTSPYRPTPSNNLDDEDWGFDFENRDLPVRTK